ncbi:MAG: PEP-CTERM sorting domain-containing protein [Nitrosospira sp.]
MKKSITFIFLLALTGPIPGMAKTTILTFDDLGSSERLIPNGYEGFNWDNFRTSDAISSMEPESGYKEGIVSPPYAAFNSGYEPASFSSTVPFNLVSIYVTKAWISGITHFDGYVGDTLRYSTDVFSTPAGPTLTTFNWSNLSKVTMSDGDNTYQSVIDNVTVSMVPEPETITVLLAGLGLIGYASRRRNKWAQAS